MQTELFRKLWKLERANYFVLEGSRLWTLKDKTTFSYLNTLASLSWGTHGVSVEWHVKYDGSLAEENSEKEGWLSVLSIK